MTCFASTGTYRTARPWLGVALSVTLFALVLPTSAWGQSPVPSLIEQGQKAGADADLLRTVATRAREAGYSAQATADLLRPAIALAEQGLPATPLMNKALEGLAKQVPTARMTPVLRQLRTHTQKAGALVSTWSSQKSTQALLGRSGPLSRAEQNRLITTIAEARQQNLPRPAVKQFLNQLPDAVQRRPVSLSKVTTAVGTMPDLPAARKNPTLARELLTAALNAGYDAESLRRLPAALEQARRTTQRPTTAIARGAARAITKGTPASTVLRSLFRGSIPGGGPPAGAGPGPPSSPPGQGKPPGAGGRPPDADPPDNPGGGQSPRHPAERAALRRRRLAPPAWVPAPAQCALVGSARRRGRRRSVPVTKTAVSAPTLPTRTATRGSGRKAPSAACAPDASPKNPAGSTSGLTCKPGSSDDVTGRAVLFIRF
ncbi:MAG: hypothetical protein ABEL97_14715 [Salinibacter sp.]